MVDAVNPYKNEFPDGTRCLVWDIFNKYHTFALNGYGQPYFSEAMVEAIEAYSQFTNSNPEFPSIVYDTWFDHFFDIWPKGY